MTSTELVRSEPLGLQLMRALEDAGELRNSAFVVTNPGLAIERVELMLALFGQHKRALSFYIGDLQNFTDVVFDETVYPNREDRFVELTGLAHETLRNYARVCARVAVARRRDELSFDHHAAAASMEPADQITWLAAAVEGGWNRTEFRQRLKDANAIPARSKLAWTPKAELLGPLEHHPPQEPLSPLTGTDPTVPSPGTLAGRERPGDALVEAVGRLVERAERAEGYYLVPSDVFDEVAALVTEE